MKGIFPTGLRSILELVITLRGWAQQAVILDKMQNEMQCATDVRMLNILGRRKLLPWQHSVILRHLDSTPSW